MGTLVKSLAWTIGLAVAKALIDYAMDRYSENRRNDREGADGKPR